MRVGTRLRPKGSAPRSPRARTPTKAVGEAAQVPDQMSQLHRQATDAGEVVHESHPKAASIPFWDDAEDEASWPGGKSRCRDYNCRCACPEGAQTEGVYTLCEQPHWELHPQGWRPNPLFGPAGPGLPQRL